jgi:hypothetical protein
VGVTIFFGGRDAEGEAPRLIRRRKWWGPAVLDAVSVARHNGKTVRVFPLSAGDHDKA